MNEDNVKQHETPPTPEPTLWDKIRKGAERISKKVSEVVTEAAENTKIAINDAMKPYKKTTPEESFAQIAQPFTCDNGKTLLAVRCGEEKLIVRSEDCVKPFTVITAQDLTLIVLDDEPEPFAYQWSHEEKNQSCACNKLNVIKAFSKTLNGHKQVLLMRAFESLDTIVADYTPSFFKRTRYAELVQNYVDFRKSVFDGAPDDNLLQSVSENMQKLIPGGMESLSAIRMQLL